MGESAEIAFCLGAALHVGHPLPVIPRPGVGVDIIETDRAGTEVRLLGSARGAPGAP